MTFYWTPGTKGLCIIMLIYISIILFYNEMAHQIWVQVTNQLNQLYIPIDHILISTENFSEHLL